MGARFRGFLGLRSAASAASAVMALATSCCLLRYIIAQVAGDAIESFCGLFDSEALERCDLWLVSALGVFRCANSEDAPTPC